MKKATCLFLQILLVGSACAQNISSIALDFGKLDQNDEVIISPNVKLDYNSHAWSVGPIFLYSFGDQVEEREALKFTGVAFGYEHYLHGKAEKWNLFHSFDFLAQRVKDVQASQYFDPNTSSFLPNEIQQIDNNLFFSANAGVLWNLNEKLSINQTIGIGLNAIFRKTESSVDSFEDSFFKQQWLLKLGLRYSME